MKLKLLSCLCIFTHLFARDAVISTTNQDRFIFDVVTLSDPIAYFYTQASNETLQSLYNMHPNQMSVSHNQFQRLLEDLNQTDFILSGSGTNVIKGLAKLGWRCSIIGRIGKDDISEVCIKKLKQLNIRSNLQKVKEVTRKCFCFTNDNLRKVTFTCFDSATEMSPVKFPKNLQNTKLLHIEGSQLLHPETIIKAIKKYKKSNTIISLDLGSDRIVKLRKEFILNLLRDSIDIVFCNELEAKELTGLSTQLTCAYLSTICHAAVITMGANGGWVGSKQGLFYFPAQRANVRDKTGVKDLFISGVLHGFLKGYTFQQCSSIGAMLASFALEEINAEISNNSWIQIRAFLQNSRLIKGY